MIKIIAEIIGYAAVLTSFVMFQQTERKRLIGCKLIMDILWIIHFLMLGGYTIVATTSISVLREIVFFNKDKPIFKSKKWLFVFIIFYALTPILTWEGYYSIFPAVSSIIATIGLWVDSVKKTKNISFWVCVGQIIYAIVRRSYAAVTNEVITMSSIIISKIRSIRGRKK